jgi:hypothetical protein
MVDPLAPIDAGWERYRDSVLVGRFNQFERFC